MSDRKVRGLIAATAILLILSGIVLYLVFDKQGMGKNKSNNFVNYDIKNYIDITPVVFNEYSDVYSSINVSKLTLKNIDKNLIDDFLEKEEVIIDYITGYYNEIKSFNNYMPTSTVTSTIKTQINDTVLSVFYRVDFDLDEEIFGYNIKSYIITYNIDLGTNKVLINDDLLSKYNYTKSYISDKLFNDDILVGKGQIVIDRNTNISLTKSDIERKKEDYVERIITEFDNIIKMYIENGSLVMVYDTKELKGIFFDNEFDTNIKFRYLK